MISDDILSEILLKLCSEENSPCGKKYFCYVNFVELIECIHFQLLKSAQLTANWERQLRFMEEGEYQLATFKQELIDLVSDFTNKVKSNLHCIKEIKIFREKIYRNQRSCSKDDKRKKTKEKDEAVIDTLKCRKIIVDLFMKGNTAYCCTKLPTI